MKTNLLQYLPTSRLAAFKPVLAMSGLQELRLRCGRHLCATVDGASAYITATGKLSPLPDGEPLTHAEISESLRAVCAYSVYSFARELKNGFVTIPGGHRVGVCGSLAGDESAKGSEGVNGLNFRIASQRIGTADSLFPLLERSQRLSSILLFGAPFTAKTTMLRDLCRQAGASHRVVLIDERGELAAMHDGRPSNDVGEMTDIFDGYPKSTAIMLALRTMSPELIFCDELGGEEEYRAVLEARSCGVSVVCTAHAGSLGELKRRFSALFEASIFDYVVELRFIGDSGRVIRLAEREGALC